MSEASIPLPLQWGVHGGTDVQWPQERREARSAEVRLVEYCPFPRVSAARGWRVGCTRDLSSSGLCLEVDRDQRVGSLLRLTIRSIDGRPALEALARVVWSRPENGGAALGLQLVDAERAAIAAPLPPGPRPVRRHHLRRIA